MRRPYWLNRSVQATTNPFLQVEDYVHTTIISITENKMVENEEICYSEMCNRLKKGNSEMTHAL